MSVVPLHYSLRSGQDNIKTLLTMTIYLLYFGQYILKNLKVSTKRFRSVPRAFRRVKSTKDGFCFGRWKLISLAKEKMGGNEKYLLQKRHLKTCFTYNLSK
jgi:hypothetical protein